VEAFAMNVDAVDGRRGRFARRAAAKIVLLVDDEAEVRQLLTRFVARLGPIAVPVGDGAQAEVLWETLRPDLVLLDLERRHADVPRLVARFKRERPRTPIVVITHEGTDQAPGADEVLRKPIRLTRLGEALARLLRAAHARRARPRPPGKTVRRKT
jgi:two-component system OmpR family response regulator